MNRLKVIQFFVLFLIFSLSLMLLQVLKFGVALGYVFSEGEKISIFSGLTSAILILVMLFFIIYLYRRWKRVHKTLIERDSRRFIDIEV